MSNALAVREEITGAEAEARAIEFLDATGKTSELMPAEKKMFVSIAREFGLNPFKREIHITAYGKGEYRKFSIITGYEVYIKRAERTGKLDGWKATVEGEGEGIKAVVEIYRNDWKYPFVHEAYYTECVQFNRDGNPNAVWAKMPKLMTRKVAIGQAFRLCFPDELGGMPYDASELPPDERNVTEGGSHTVLTPDSETPPPENRPPQSRGKKPGENGQPPNGPDLTEAESEIVSLSDDIGRIFGELNPDRLPWFGEDEVAANRETLKAARKKRDLAAVKAQHNFLIKELARRKADHKPVPFGDEGEFKNDIPWEDAGSAEPDGGDIF